MNNKRVLSMLISIALIGITLISLAISYNSFQSDLENIDKEEAAEDIRVEKERAEKERLAEEEYQQMLTVYYAELERRETEKRQAEEEGRPYMKFDPVFMPIKPSASVTSFHNWNFDVKREELSKEFKNKIIIHGIIIGFIILAEIGILIVLPRKDKTVNVVIKK